MLRRKENVTINGESVIDGKVVCNFVAQIDSNAPENMTLSMWQNDKTAYKEHRDSCRADQAEFEDYAYARQDEMIRQKQALTEVAEASVIWG